MEKVCLSKELLQDSKTETKDLSGESIVSLPIGPRYLAAP
jgi:hypothetical protein